MKVGSGLLACCLALGGGAAWADPSVVVFPAIGKRTEVTVSGVAFKAAPGSGRNAFARNLRRLTASPWEEGPVEVSLEGKVVQVVADEGGGFSATFHFAPPLEPGLHEVEARIPGAVGKAAVQLLEEAAPFLLISDLDDTLSVTNVLEKRKLVKAAFFEDAETQPAVPGMAAWYQCMRSDKPAAPAIAVVTGTPLQYGTRTVAWLAKSGFPFSALYPRELGPDSLQGYKQPVIRRLLTELPEPAVCVGDSGEQDPEVYSQISREFPGRIGRIYIHDVGRDEEPKRFDGMFLFHDAREAALDAVAHGYMTRACFNSSFAAR